MYQGPQTIFYVIFACTFFNHPQGPPKRNREFSCPLICLRFIAILYTHTLFLMTCSLFTAPNPHPLTPTPLYWPSCLREEEPEYARYGSFTNTFVSLGMPYLSALRKQASGTDNFKIHLQMFKWLKFKPTGDFFFVNCNCCAVCFVRWMSYLLYVAKNSIHGF